MKFATNLPIGSDAINMTQVDVDTLYHYTIDIDWPSMDVKQSVYCSKHK